MTIHSHPDFSRSVGAQTACPPMHTARELTAGGTRAQIELDGKVYDLRITRAGKLILTK